MNEHEAAQRDEPKAGEWWYFSNGKTGYILEPEMNSGSTFPEIAVADPDADKPDGWKFNSVHDPLPIRKVDGPERPKPVERYGYPITIAVTLPLMEWEYEKLRADADRERPLVCDIRERLGLSRLPMPEPDTITLGVVPESQYLEDFPEA